MDGREGYVGLFDEFILAIRERSYPKEDAGCTLNIEIELLKKEVERKDEEISRLKHVVESLREENRNINASLNSKNKEISGLKLEIKKLHAEKKELENRVTHLQAEVGTLNAKVCDLNKEVANLKEENGGLKVDNLALEEKVDALTRTVTDMKREFQPVQTENARLSKEVNNLNYRRSQEREVHEKRQAALEGLNASLILGELFWKIQSLIYQKVFPKSYHPKESYQVKYIDEDISTIEDGHERKLAAQTWENIQKEVEWDTKLFTRTMKSIQVQMNVAAHPKLTEASLLQSANLMCDRLYGPETLARVKKLIGIWKKLVSM